MKIARVFPRRTNATPDDELSFTKTPPKEMSEIDEVHISVAFTYDLEKAEQLYKEWSVFGVPVKMGGAAFNEPGGEFIPGRYLKNGYVITSRGCHNRCWFCSVPKREGYKLRELPIKDGFNILDDNLLACSDDHIRAVFDMLKRQTEKPVFTGGLEAKILKSWHVELLKESKTKRIYFAYDTPDDYEPLLEAGKLLYNGGFTRASCAIRCYVLIGYPGDTMEAAEKRLLDAWKAGFFPFAMLYKNELGEANPDWKQFQRLWVRPEILFSRLKELTNI